MDLKTLACQLDFYKQKFFLNLPKADFHVCFFFVDFEYIRISKSCKSPFVYIDVAH